MDRGGTSIDELMRQPNNSNISEDESMVQSILEEINQDKEQINMQQQQQMNQQQQQQMNQQQQQKMMEKQMYEKKQQEMMMMKQRQQIMEKQRMIQQNQQNQQNQQIKTNDNNDNNDNEKNMCENISLLDEFKSTIIFFSIFILINITQFNSLICGALSIENNNIFILLKTFVATVIFFFINKLVHKYI